MNELNQLKKEKEGIKSIKKRKRKGVNKLKKRKRNLIKFLAYFFYSKYQRIGNH